MKRECWNCKHRLKENDKPVWDERTGWDTYYPCEVKSKEGVTVRVSPDHKACSSWEKTEE